ncbi:MAG: CDP-alcohol phosphatidyltransferase family protein [Corynebacterium sp.]|nr:CDP-alcohol phosphatidyltransferase family protein [Corynebacterium sp.]
MLSTKGRKPAAVVVEPVAGALVKAGISPNAITIIGTVITVAISVCLIPTGHLVIAAILTAVFTAFDMLDGTMARMRGGGTKFGATLDASCDRIADGALFGAIAWWLVYTDKAHQVTMIACMITLVSSQVISYVKARAEASGFKIVGGLIERPERLIIGLLGIGLEGLGVPWAVEVSLWILAVGSIFTVIQRLYMASTQPVALEHIAAPAGAKEFSQEEKN